MQSLKFKKGLFVCIFFCLCLLASESWAHFMWLNAGDFTPPENKTGKFTIGWGHAFFSPVGNILTDNNRLDEIYMIDSQGKKEAVTALDHSEYQAAKPLKNGSYLAMVKSKEGFSTKTTTGYKSEPKKGLEGVLSSHYIGMYGKAIINVGDAPSCCSIMEPVGDTLEIVPLANPADLKEGDYFKFKLLYNGKPVSETVNATYVGFSYDGAWAYTTKTGKDGIGEVKMLTPGVWLIKANVKEPYPDPKMSDDYSFTAALTFEVR